MKPVISQEISQESVRRPRFLFLTALLLAGCSDGKAPVHEKADSGSPQLEIIDGNSQSLAVVLHEWEERPVNNFLNKTYTHLGPILRAALQEGTPKPIAPDITNRLNFTGLSYQDLSIGQEAHLVACFCSTDTIEASVATAAVENCNKTFNADFVKSVKEFLAKFPQHDVERNVGKIVDGAVVFELLRPSRQIERMLVE